MQSEEVIIMPEPTQPEAGAVQQPSAPQPSGTPAPQVPETPPTPQPKTESTPATPQAPTPSAPAPSAPSAPATFEIGGQPVPIDELKAGYMRSKDYTEKTQLLAEKARQLEAIQGVLSPQPPTPPPTPPEYLTQDQVEKLFAEREQKLEQKAALKQEVTKLSEEFTGTDGRPKYDDNEIWQWQSATGQTYLPPRDAFKKKYENELLDWEVKQRLAKAGSPVFTEQPQAGNVNLPQGKKVFVDEKGNEDEAGRKAAILDTWNKMEGGQYYSVRRLDDSRLTE